MPLKTWDNKADYDAYYDLDATWATGRLNTEPKQRLGYEREVLFSQAEIRANKYVELLNLKTNQKILILGCGFGWSVEALENLGYSNIKGVDTSTYILTELAGDTNKDIYKGTSEILSDEGNFKPQVVITENVLESYSDADTDTLLSKYAGVTLAHLVVTELTDNPDNLNIKTLEQWKALRPNDLFMEESPWRIL